MDWFLKFPFKININTDIIDKAVRGFAATYSSFFDGIKKGLTEFVNLINLSLGSIPWLLIIAAVFVLSWKAHKRVFSGIIYSVLLCFIGVIYSMVPAVRLTSLGIQEVDKEVVEAARAFGSTKLQLLLKVQVPQALPTIMTGVNQTLMMAMSMVVTCSMIGARGLGNEVLIAVNRIEISRGFIAGSAVVILAIILDRLTQGWFSKKEKKSGTIK